MSLRHARGKLEGSASQLSYAFANASAALTAL